MEKMFPVSSQSSSSIKADGYIDQLLKDNNDAETYYASIYCYASATDIFKKAKRKRSDDSAPTFFVNVDGSSKSIDYKGSNKYVRTERIPDTDIVNVNWFLTNDIDKVSELTRKRRSRIHVDDNNATKCFIVYLRYSEVREAIRQACVKSNRPETAMIRASYGLANAIRSVPAAQKKIFNILKKTVDIPVLEEWTSFLLGCNSISIYPCRAYYADIENPRNIYAFKVLFCPRSVTADISRALNQGHISINGSKIVSSEFNRIHNLTDYLEHFSSQLINKAANKFSAVFDPNKENFTADENNYFDFTAYNSSLKMFNTQKNVIGAVSRALNKDNSALIVGEMGVGILL